MQRSNEKWTARRRWKRKTKDSSKEYECPRDMEGGGGGERSGGIGYEDEILKWQRRGRKVRGEKEKKVGKEKKAVKRKRNGKRRKEKWKEEREKREMKGKKRRRKEGEEEEKRMGEEGNRERRGGGGGSRRKSKPLQLSKGNEG